MVEVGYLARRAKTTVREALERLRDAGVGSMPGGGAEIFCERVRRIICDHKVTGEEWLEIARTELLRTSGVTYSELESRGVFLVITRLECKYRRPSFYDDLLEIKAKWIGGSKFKIEHDYEVILRESAAGHRAQSRHVGDTLLVASTTLACVDAAGRIQPLPAWLAG